MASKDFVHWRRLPVAIWNDRWYDKAAVWTFSATIVDGSPVMVYPGIATPNQTFGDCKGMCFTHSVALPADPSDPWLIDWIKPDYNPIRMGTQRDPSTAWRTSAGEWRYTNVAKEVFSSWDFKSWELAGILDEFGGGECPDFFELPPLCEGCAVPAHGTFQPTHVHANVAYQLGIYKEGPENSTGNWSVDPDWNPQQTKMDGHDSDLFYASKSFWDSAKGRRIFWGWVKLGTWYEDADGFRAGKCQGLGQLMTNTNSLPRVTTYDPSLQKLLFFPVEELVDLRGKRLLKSGSKAVFGRTALDVGDEAVRQSEFHVSFEMPMQATKLGISVMTGEVNGSHIGTDFFIDFVPGDDDTWLVDVGHDSSSMQCPNKTKSGLGKPAFIPCPSKTLPMPLKRSDKTLDIAVWVDNLVVEAYFMAGRSAWTVAVPCSALLDGSRGAELFASTSVTLRSADAWSVKSLTYEDVPEMESVTV